MVGKDYQWRVSGIFTNIILILRSGMKKVIKRIFLGVFDMLIFALGAGIIPSYYFLEDSEYEF